jgi:TolA-binding protein
MIPIRSFVVLTLCGSMLASCAFRSSESSFGPYSAAETYYKKGNYSKAVEKYQEYLAGNPQGNMAAIAEYYIGKSYAASGDMTQAKESFDRVVTKFPGTSWAEFAKDQLATLGETAKV